MKILGDKCNNFKNVIIDRGRMKKVYKKIFNY